MLELQYGITAPTSTDTEANAAWAQATGRAFDASGVGVSVTPGDLTVEHSDSDSGQASVVDLSTSVPIAASAQGSLDVAPGEATNDRRGAAAAQMGLTASAVG